MICVQLAVTRLALTCLIRSQEVCGLKFSSFDDVILASGGNDNRLFIWDLRKTLTTNSSSSPVSTLPNHHRGRLSSTPFANVNYPAVTAGSGISLPPIPIPRGATSQAMARAAAVVAADRAHEFESVVKSVDDTLLPSAYRPSSSSLTPYSDLYTSSSSTNPGPGGLNGGAFGFGYGGVTTPVFQASEHRATVRGLAWSPHTRGLLASGGGKQEPIIRFWNTISGRKIDQVVCDAQVRCLWYSSWGVSRSLNVTIHGAGYGSVLVYYDR